MAGVTSTGWVSKTFADVKADLQASWRKVFGAAVNVDDRSRNGQMIAALAGSLEEVWKLGESLASLFSQPTGVFLDFISKLTGTQRLPATPSKAVLTLTGTPTTVVAAGKQAAVNGTAVVFATDALATIVAATAWATGTNYAAGVRRTANGNVYVCITPGVSAGAGTGPAGTGADIVDGGAHWRFVGPGTGYVDAPATATATGPSPAYAFTVTVISTPVAGWAGVNNLLDAVVGANVETDAALRLRRLAEIAALGRSPVNALRAAISKVPGVSAAIVFENVADFAVNGIPAHGIASLVVGGIDADIAAAIFANKSGGIQTSGTTTVAVNDSAGIGHNISFSRPTPVPIYIAYLITKDPASYPHDGDDQVRAAGVTAGDQLTLGFDVWASRAAAAIFEAEIPGVLDVSCTVDTVHPPVAAHVVITPTQQATFDTGRVDVTTVNGSP